MPNKDQQYALEAKEWFNRFRDFLPNRGIGLTLIDSLHCLELLLPKESIGSDSPPKTVAERSIPFSQ